MLCKKACHQCVQTHRENLLSEKKQALEKCWQDASTAFQKYQQTGEAFDLRISLLNAAKAATDYDYVFDDDYEESFENCWADEEVWCPLRKKRRTAMSIHSRPPDGCPYVLEQRVFDQEL